LVYGTEPLAYRNPWWWRIGKIAAPGAFQLVNRRWENAPFSLRAGRPGKTAG
jgi:hypothetical protein